MSQETLPRNQLLAERMLDEAISALTLADADRLEALLRSLEDRERVVIVPSTAAEWQRAAEKYRLLRQLLGLTAGNIRVFKRILPLDRAPVYGYGAEMGNHNLSVIEKDTLPVDMTSGPMHPAACTSPTDRPAPEYPEAGTMEASWLR